MASTQRRDWNRIRRQHPITMHAPAKRNRMGSSTAYPTLRISSQRRRHSIQKRREPRTDMFLRQWTQPEPHHTQVTVRLHSVLGRRTSGMEIQTPRPRRPTLIRRRIHGTITRFPSSSRDAASISRHGIRTPSQSTNTNDR